MKAERRITLTVLFGCVLALAIAAYAARPETGTLQYVAQQGDASFNSRPQAAVPSTTCTSITVVSQLTDGGIPCQTWSPDAGCQTYYSAASLSANVDHFLECTVGACLKANAYATTRTTTCYDSDVPYKTGWGASADGGASQVWAVTKSAGGTSGTCNACPVTYVNQ